MRLLCAKDSLVLTHADVIMTLNYAFKEDILSVEKAIEVAGTTCRCMWLKLVLTRGCCIRSPSHGAEQSAARTSL